MHEGGVFSASGDASQVKRPRGRPKGPGKGVTKVKKVVKEAGRKTTKKSPLLSPTGKTKTYVIHPSEVLCKPDSYGPDDNKQSQSGPRSSHNSGEHLSVADVIRNNDPTANIASVADNKREPPLEYGCCFCDKIFSSTAELEYHYTRHFLSFAEYTEFISHVRSTTTPLNSARKKTMSIVRAKRKKSVSVDAQDMEEDDLGSGFLKELKEITIEKNKEAETESRAEFKPDGTQVSEVSSVSQQVKNRICSDNLSGNNKEQKVMRTKSPAATDRKCEVNASLLSMMKESEETKVETVQSKFKHVHYAESSLCKHLNDNKVKRADNKNEKEAEDEKRKKASDKTAIENKTWEADDKKGKKADVKKKGEVEDKKRKEEDDDTKGTKAIDTKESETIRKGTTNGVLMDSLTKSRLADHCKTILQTLTSEEKESDTSVLKKKVAKNCNKQHKQSHISVSSNKHPRAISRHDLNTYHRKKHKKKHSDTSHEVRVDTKPKHLNNLTPLTVSLKRCAKTDLVRIAHKHNLVLDTHILARQLSGCSKQQQYKCVPSSKGSGCTIKILKQSTDKYDAQTIKTCDEVSVDTDNVEIYISSAQDERDFRNYSNVVESDSVVRKASGNCAIQKESGNLAAMLHQQGSYDETDSGSTPRLLKRTKNCIRLKSDCDNLSSDFDYHVKVPKLITSGKCVKKRPSKDKTVMSKVMNDHPGPMELVLDGCNTSEKNVDKELVSKSEASNDVCQISDEVIADVPNKATNGETDLQMINQIEMLHFLEDSIDTTLHETFVARKVNRETDLDSMLIYDISDIMVGNSPEVVKDQQVSVNSVGVENLRPDIVDTKIGSGDQDSEDSGLWQGDSSQTDEVDASLSGMANEVASNESQVEVGIDPCSSSDFEEDMMNKMLTDGFIVSDESNDIWVEEEVPLETDIIISEECLSRPGNGYHSVSSPECLNPDETLSPNDASFSGFEDLSRASTCIETSPRSVSNSESFLIKSVNISPEKSQMIYAEAAKTFPVLAELPVKNVISEMDAAGDAKLRFKFNKKIGHEPHSMETSSVSNELFSLESEMDATGDAKLSMDKKIEHVSNSMKMRTTTIELLNVENETDNVSKDKNAKETGNVRIGERTKETGNVGIGERTKETGNVGIGERTKETGNGNVGIGERIKETGNVGIGERTKETGNVRIGERTKETGNVGIGERTIETGNVRIGERTKETGNVGIGERTKETGNVRIGERTKETGNVGIGERTKETGNVGIGERTKETGYVRIGERTKETGNVGIGERTKETGNVGIGERTKETGNVGIGERTKETGNVGIGERTKETGNVRIGERTKETGNVGIGERTKETGNVGIGERTKETGNVRIGERTKETGNVGIGERTKETGNVGIAKETGNVGIGERTKETGNVGIAKETGNVSKDEKTKTDHISIDKKTKDNSKTKKVVCSQTSVSVDRITSETKNDLLAEHSSKLTDCSIQKKVKKHEKVKKHKQTKEHKSKDRLKVSDKKGEQLTDFEKALIPSSKEKKHTSSKDRQKKKDKHRERQNSADSNNNKAVTEETETFLKKARSAPILKPDSFSISKMAKKIYEEDKKKKNQPKNDGIPDFSDFQLSLHHIEPMKVVDESVSKDVETKTNGSDKLEVDDCLSVKNDLSLQFSVHDKINPSSDNDQCTYSNKIQKLTKGKSDKKDQHQNVLDNVYPSINMKLSKSLSSQKDTLEELKKGLECLGGSSLNTSMKFKDFKSAGLKRSFTSSATSDLEMPVVKIPKFNNTSSLSSAWNMSALSDTGLRKPCTDLTFMDGFLSPEKSLMTNNKHGKNKFMSSVTTSSQNGFKTPSGQMNNNLSVNEKVCKNGQKLFLPNSPLSLTCSFTSSPLKDPPSTSTPLNFKTGMQSAFQPYGQNISMVRRSRDVLTPGHDDDAGTKKTKRICIKRCEIPYDDTSSPDMDSRVVRRSSGTRSTVTEMGEDVNNRNGSKSLKSAELRKLSSFLSSPANRFCMVDKAKPDSEHNSAIDTSFSGNDSQLKRMESYDELMFQGSDTLSDMVDEVLSMTEEDRESQASSVADLDDSRTVDNELEKQYTATETASASVHYRVCDVVSDSDRRSETVVKCADENDTMMGEEESELLDLSLGLDLTLREFDSAHEACTDHRDTRAATNGPGRLFSPRTPSPPPELDMDQTPEDDDNNDEYSDNNDEYMNIPDVQYTGYQDTDAEEDIEDEIANAFNEKAVASRGAYSVAIENNEDDARSNNEDDARSNNEGENKVEENTGSKSHSDRGHQSDSDDDAGNEVELELEVPEEDMLELFASDTEFLEEDSVSDKINSPRSPSVTPPQAVVQPIKAEKKVEKVPLEMVQKIDSDIYECENMDIDSDAQTDDPGPMPKVSPMKTVLQPQVYPAVTRPTLPIPRTAGTQHNFSGRGQWVPSGYCHSFFSVKPCRQTPCRFSHGPVRKEDLLAELPKIPDYCQKGDLDKVMYILGSHQLLQSAIIPADIIFLYQTCLRHGRVEFAVRVINLLAGRDLITPRVINDFVYFWDRIQSSEVEHLWAVFLVARSCNIQPQQEALNVMLRSFLDNEQWQLVWEVLLYTTEIEDYSVPLQFVVMALHTVTTQHLYVDLAVAWLQETDLYVIQALDSKLLSAVSDVLRQHNYTDMAMKLEEIISMTATHHQPVHPVEPRNDALQGTRPQEPNKSKAQNSVGQLGLGRQTPVERHFDDNASFVEQKEDEEERKRVMQGIKSSRYVKSWNYLADLFVERSCRSCPVDPGYVHQFISVLASDLPKTHLFFADFLEQVFNIAQHKRKEHVPVRVDLSALMYIGTHIFYQCHKKGLLAQAHELLTILAKQALLKLNPSSAPEHKDVSVLALDLCIHQKDARMAVKIMKGVNIARLEPVFRARIFTLIKPLLILLASSSMYICICSDVIELVFVCFRENLVAYSEEFDLAEATSDLILTCLEHNEMVVLLRVLNLFNVYETPFDIAPQVKRCLLVFLCNSQHHAEYRAFIERLYADLRQCRVYQPPKVDQKVLWVNKDHTPVEVFLVIREFLEELYQSLCTKVVENIQLTLLDCRFSINISCRPIVQDPKHLQMPFMQETLASNPALCVESVLHLFEPPLDLVPSRTSTKSVCVDPASVEIYLHQHDKQGCRQGLRFCNTVPVNGPKRPFVQQGREWPGY